MASSSSLVDAESMRSLPPFYTLQPVLATRQKQLKLWTQVLVNFQKQKRRSLLHLHDDDANEELFSNAKIKRRLSESGIRAVMQEMVKEGFGLWQDASHTTLVTSWKRFDEWSNLIYKWATESGHLNDICTVYEIHSGQMTSPEEFHGISGHVVLEALKLLEQQGKASLIEAETVDETGVKFIEL